MHEAPETLYRTLGTREWELQGSLFGECLWINPTAHVALASQVDDLFMVGTRQCIKDTFPGCAEEESGDRVE